jgi:hypothetical protein
MLRRVALSGVADDDEGKRLGTHARGITAKVGGGWPAVVFRV